MLPEKNPLTFVASENTNFGLIFPHWHKRQFWKKRWFGLVCRNFVSATFNTLCNHFGRIFLLKRFAQDNRLVHICLAIGQPLKHVHLLYILYHRNRKKCEEMCRIVKASNMITLIDWWCMGFTSWDHVSLPMNLWSTSWTLWDMRTEINMRKWHQDYNFHVDHVHVYPQTMSWSHSHAEGL